MTDATKLRPDEFLDVLEFEWPHVWVDEAGRCVASAEDTRRLEALFRVFGVPMLVRDNSLNVLGHAFDTFVLGFSDYVRRCLLRPRAFEEQVYDWPQHWCDYVRAVARQDLAQARRLAVQLQPLAPGCAHPPRLFAALFK